MHMRAYLASAVTAQSLILTQKQFAEEMLGLRDGGRSIGIPDMDKLAQVILNLWN